MMTTNPRQFATRKPTTEPMPTRGMSHDVYLVHAYGEPVADWCNTPLVTSDYACASHDAMSCYAQARRAPHLDEYDHDAQGF